MGNPDDVRLLILKRGQVKAKVTRIFNALNVAHQKNQHPSLPQLRVYSKQLSTIYQEYNDTHDMVMAAVPEESVEVQEEKYVEFESLFNDTSTMIETMIEDIEKENRVPQPAPMSTSTGTPPAQQPIIVQPQSFRAPLPIFDGRYESWPRFKAMFQDLMQHSADSDAVKLYHLENSLKGDAAGVIDLETLQNNNYQRAWDILEERFGNQRLILESHILGILNLKKMTKKSSKDLRNLIDECTRHVENLVKHNQPLTGMSDLLVVTVLTRALDDQTRELWEASIDQTKLPEYEPTIEFLKQRCIILERCENSSLNPKALNPKVSVPNAQPFNSSNVASVPPEYVCDICSGQHQNYKCSYFLKLSVDQRHAKTREVHLCFNCLRKGHHSVACWSDKLCAKCAKKHHTLLHYDREQLEVKPRDISKLPVVKPDPVVIEQPVNSSCSSSVPPTGKHVFLMTAMVNLVTKNGQCHPVRALLDSGSQINILAESVVQRLKLTKYPEKLPVIGVGGTVSQLHHKVVVRMTSNSSDFATNVECHTAPKVTGTIPSVRVNIGSWNIPPGIVLADASFHCPREVEMLIGAELFFKILKQGWIKLSNRLPSLYETHFGWAVAGSYDDEDNDKPLCTNPIVRGGSQECTQRSFNEGNVIESAMISTREQRFEENFKRPYQQEEVERNVISLPIHHPVNPSNNLRSPAMRQYPFQKHHSTRNSDLKSKNAEFIEDCLALVYHLPHHCILKSSLPATTSFAGQQRVSSTRFETAFQRAGVCSRKFAPSRNNRRSRTFQQRIDSRTFEESS